MPRNYVYRQFSASSCSAATLMIIAAELGYQVLQHGSLGNDAANLEYQKYFPTPVNIKELIENMQGFYATFDERNDMMTVWMPKLYEFKRRMKSQDFNGAEPLLLGWLCEACIHLSTESNKYGIRHPRGSWPSAIINIAHVMGFRTQLKLYDTAVTGRILQNPEFADELSILESEIFPHLAAISEVSSPSRYPNLQQLSGHLLPPPVPVSQIHDSIPENTRAFLLLNGSHWVMLRPDGSFMNPGSGTNTPKSAISPVTYEAISIQILIST